MNDTNLVASLVAALAANKAALAPVVASPNNTLLVVAMIIAAFSPILSALAAYFSKAAALNTAETKVASLETAKSVDLIHTAVNSERTETLKTIATLRDEILKLTEKAAFAEGKKDSKS